VFEYVGHPTYSFFEIHCRIWMLNLDVGLRTFMGSSSPIKVHCLNFDSIRTLKTKFDV